MSLKQSDGPSVDKDGAEGGGGSQRCERPVTFAMTGPLREEGAGVTPAPPALPFLLSLSRSLQNHSVHADDTLGSIFYTRPTDTGEWRL